MIKKAICWYVRMSHMYHTGTTISPKCPCCGIQHVLTRKDRERADWAIPLVEVSMGLFACFFMIGILALIVEG